MRTSLVLSLLLVSAAAPAFAQMGDPTKVNLRVAPVAGGVSMIDGADGFAGGNVAVLAGDDGVIVVDDELAPMTAKLKTIIGTVSKKSIRFVINTHWHGDHTGGNAALGGGGALLVAHDNVRKRLSTDQFIEMMGKRNPVPASPPAALPVVTFGDDVTLHLDGEDIHAVHVPPAHTDGDAFIVFPKANVIASGDVVTAGFPIVDVANGGKYDGFITAADKILALCNDGTKIIPGHGPVMSRADLQGYREMVVTLRGRVAKLMAQNKTLDQIKAAKPTADLDAKWGQGFAKADMVLETMVKTVDPKAPVPKK
jgi:cyclase